MDENEVEERGHVAEKMSGQDGGEEWRGRSEDVRDRDEGRWLSQSETAWAERKEKREKRRWLWQSRSVREERQSEGKTLPLIEVWAWSCPGWVAQRSSVATSSGRRHRASLRTASPRFHRAIMTRSISVFATIKNVSLPHFFQPIVYRRKIGGDDLRRLHM